MTNAAEREDGGPADGGAAVISFMCSESQIQVRKKRIKELNKISAAEGPVTGFSFTWILSLHLPSFGGSFVIDLWGFCSDASVFA